VEVEGFFLNEITIKVASSGSNGPLLAPCALAGSAYIKLRNGNFASLSFTHNNLPEELREDLAKVVQAIEAAISSDVGIPGSGSEVRVPKSLFKREI
jgi:hypothetical protein